ncbi:MAG: hypothetical protein M0Z38_06695 [Deltaproteobacteria bacterium]|nr:hypothetical protein [Deltaproteobacteria bacterium]
MALLHIRMMVVAAALVVSTTCHGFEWTKTDTAFQAAQTAALVADWAQTRYTARDWNRQAEHQEEGVHYKETNPFLGEYPSMRKVDRYFIGFLVGATAVSIALPNPYRRIWQTFWIIYEVDFVRKNHSIGVKIRF